MTDEAKGVTEKWVKAKGVKYAYAYDKGGKLARRFGVRGIPHSILVGPSGTILWRGHPGMLDHEQVEAALVGALTRPVYEWPGEASSVKNAFVHGKYAKALELAQALKADELGIAKSIQALITQQTAAMKSAYEAQSYARALALAEENADGFKGLPEAAEAEALIAKIKADPELKVIVKGQQKLAELRRGMSTMRRQKDADKLISAAEKLARKYDGTIVQTQARELVDECRKKRRKLR